MTDPTAPVRLWRQLLTPFGFVLTQPGFARFAQWVTGTVFADEEHTITQILTSLGMEDRWRSPSTSPSTGVLPGHRRAADPAAHRGRARNCGSVNHLP